MRLLGIDPGATGALAFLTLGGPSGLRPEALEFVDLADLSRRVGRRSVLDPYAVAREVDARCGEDDPPIDAAILEQGAVRPQNGRVGAAAFWLGLGTLRGIVAAHFIPLEVVSPASWKRALRVPADKDAARLRASTLFPAFSGLWARVKDHGRAEAALIALHGASLLPAHQHPRGRHGTGDDGLMVGLDRPA